VAYIAARPLTIGAETRQRCPGERCPEVGDMTPPARQALLKGGCVEDVTEAEADRRHELAVKARADGLRQWLAKRSAKAQAGLDRIAAEVAELETKTAYARDRAKPLDAELQTYAAALARLETGDVACVEALIQGKSTRVQPLPTAPKVEPKAEPKPDRRSVLNQRMAVSTKTQILEMTAAELVNTELGEEPTVEMVESYLATDIEERLKIGDPRKARKEDLIKACVDALCDATPGD